MHEGNPETTESTWQNTGRLSAFCDEGDSGAAFQLSDAEVAVLFAIACINFTEKEAVPAIRPAESQVGLVLKSAGAPWHTSSCRKRDQKDHVLVDMVAVGVAHDCGVPPNYSMKQVTGKVRIHLPELTAGQNPARQRALPANCILVFCNAFARERGQLKRVPGRG